MLYNKDILPFGWLVWFGKPHEGRGENLLGLLLILYNMYPDMVLLHYERPVFGRGLFFLSSAQERNQQLTHKVQNREQDEEN